MEKITKEQFLKLDNEMKCKIIKLQIKGQVKIGGN